MIKRICWPFVFFRLTIPVFLTRQIGKKELLPMVEHCAWMVLLLSLQKAGIGFPAYATETWVFGRMSESNLEMNWKLLIHMWLRICLCLTLLLSILSFRRRFIILLKRLVLLICILILADCQLFIRSLWMQMKRGWLSWLLMSVKNCKWRIHVSGGRMGMENSIYMMHL